jgi:SAM-dependent methyltransferase
MSDIRLTVDVSLEPATAFGLLVEEVALALARWGMRFDAGAGGQVFEADVPIGTVTAWEVPRGFALEWRGASWNPDAVVEVRLTLEPAPGGTRATLEQRGFETLIGDETELPGWLAGQVLAPLLRASTPGALGDWITDRRARRPSGAQARTTYGDPLYHYPSFRVILAELALTRDDYLLEVGCGGGALLKLALESGCRAAAIDHSADMVRLARETNRYAVATGRLEVREADASSLPFPDATFSCAAMTGVLGFLPDPVRAFGEVRRTLTAGGRFVSLGADAELKGTPAAPEPMASRLRFYDAAQLEDLGRRAGFEEVTVVRRDLEPFAREAGVPSEHLPLFAPGPAGGASFLIARKR